MTWDAMGDNEEVPALAHDWLSHNVRHCHILVRKIQIKVESVTFSALNSIFTTCQGPEIPKGEREWPLNLQDIRAKSRLDLTCADI